jgi:hypothetical protein
MLKGTGFLDSRRSLTRRMPDGNGIAKRRINFSQIQKYTKPLLKVVSF